MSWTDNIHENYEEYKPILATIFKELRKEGFIARMNYLCCGNCAGHAIADYVDSLSDEKRAKIKGCVFWHHQDESYFKERGKLYLRYGNLETSEHGDVGLPTKEVGDVIAKKLADNGINYEWDGDPDKCITIGVVKNDTVVEDVKEDILKITTA